MKYLPVILLSLLGAPAAAGPWPYEADPDSDDGVAQAPTEAEAPIELDLASVRSTLEDSVRQILQSGADPVAALPLDVEPAPQTTAAELRGLLDGSGAHTASLDALSTTWILWKGEAAVLEARAVIRPDKSTTLLRLAVVEGPDTPSHKPLHFPGGLGVSWSRAEQVLGRTLREARCADLPLASDALLNRLVPSTFLETTVRARNAAAPARGALCSAAQELGWDRLELRPSEIHFNLYDKAGTLRGGLQLRTTDKGDSTQLAYPLFKRLPDTP
ncbi:MAG: hypothetical protein EA397_10360 [Deltaproteobacteria bacterium]|nr:MAG: hypothetical protein EA397_10360 [Deltaproteobacteria bacterium]